ncbi:hypothetical protein [Acidipila sp. EB88]|uniref:hypothetical protein n=1 Tax=Acidipila sp. EB88 TaxID=2305226 RepID=UPI000F5DF603|nr:hypothetical protein [Acidipila sp. EB88]
MKSRRNLSGEWREMPNCPHCEKAELRRHGRFGFMERVVFTYFGYYPWECGLCRRIFRLRQRFGVSARSASLPAVAVPARMRYGVPRKTHAA